MKKKEKKYIKIQKGIFNLAEQELKLLFEFLNCSFCFVF